MLLLVLLSVLPHETIARESCDRIEVNAMYDDRGLLVFDQLLFYDWQGERFQIRAWRMVKNANQLPRLNHATNRYECHWQDGEVERVITAPVVMRTQTQFDPELTERSYLPKELRRELLTAKAVEKRAGLRR